MIASFNAPAACATEEAVELLRTAARLMLEYNVRSSVLARHMAGLAGHLGVPLRLHIAYCSVHLFLDDGRCFLVQVPEYRLNVARSAGVLRILDETCGGRLTPADALNRVARIQASRPSQPLWLLVLIFGLAASALARILQADLGAILLAGAASALGLVVRRFLGHRHWPLFSLPFLAGAIGGLLGGMAIRLGWTDTPGLCILVPALMLVPGPHLINGVYDIFENHVVTGLCRLTLAGGILLAAALGTLLGVWLAGGMDRITGATTGEHPELWLDMVLAGVAACGFGAFYNAPWRILWISIACGMIGHGIRYLGQTQGMPVAGATLLACLAIGLLANSAALCFRLSFSSIAFAGAVPMMPGTLIYRSLAGTLQLALAGTPANSTQAADAWVLMLGAIMVVGAMAGGLLIGSLVASWLVKGFERLRPGAAGITCSIGPELLPPK